MSYLRIAIAAAAVALAAPAGAADTSTSQSPGASSSGDASATRPMDSQAAPGGQYDAALVRSVQQALTQHGHDTGSAADGQWNASTEIAVRGFQASKGLPQTGNLDQPTLAALGVGSPSAVAAPPMSLSGPVSGTGSSTLRSTPSSGTGATSGSPKY
jgi:peptidoglycan hydrolase-like protein with peptidoglycan-binding domain